MDSRQDDACEGFDPHVEESPSSVILFEYPLDQEGGSARKGKACRTRIWLEHPRMLEPNSPRPSAHDVTRVRDYPREHQITGTGLHKLDFHWPRPLLSKLEEHDYHGVVSRLERFLTAQEVPVSHWRAVGDNVVSRFAGLFGSEMARAGGKIHPGYFVPAWEILFRAQIAAYESEEYVSARSHLQRWLQILQPTWTPDSKDPSACVTRSACDDHACQRPTVLFELQRFVRHAASLYITERELRQAHTFLRTWIDHATKQNFKIDCSHYWDMYFWLEAELGGDSWARMNGSQYHYLLEKRKIHQPSDLRLWSAHKREAMQEAALAFKCFRKGYANNGPLAVFDRGGDDLAQANMIIQLVVHPPGDLRIFGRAVKENRDNPKLGQLLRAVTENQLNPSVIFRALCVSFELTRAAREVDFIIGNVEPGLRAVLEGYRDRRISEKQVVDHLSDRTRVRAWVHDFKEVMASGHAIGF